MVAQDRPGIVEGDHPGARPAEVRVVLPRQRPEGGADHIELGPVVDLEDLVQIGGHALTVAAGSLIVPDPTAQTLRCVCPGDSWSIWWSGWARGVTNVQPGSAEDADRPTGTVVPPGSAARSRQVDRVADVGKGG